MAYNLRELEKLRKELEERHYKWNDNTDPRRFPWGDCLDIAREVSLRLGYPMTSGEFVQDDGLCHTHYWNYDYDTDTIIDLSADQFDRTRPGVTVLKRTSPEARKRYLHLPID